MRTYKQELGIIAQELLTQDEDKPNYSNIDFMNITIIFHTALMDKMYDNQDYDNMNFEDRLKMSESCGSALRKLIHTYTGIDTHKVEEDFKQFYAGYEYAMQEVKNKIELLPSYDEIVFAFKETHNLYIEAIRNSYLTHDITRVMSNDDIFKRLENKNK